MTPTSTARNICVYISYSIIKERTGVQNSFYGYRYVVCLRVLLVLLTFHDIILRSLCIGNNLVPQTACFEYRSLWAAYSYYALYIMPPCCHATMLRSLTLLNTDLSRCFLRTSCLGTTSLGPSASNSQYVKLPAGLLLAPLWLSRCVGWGFLVCFHRSRCLGGPLILIRIIYVLKF